MNVWIVGVGEPLPIDGENVRLRRVGNLAKFISNTENEVHWFSVSFNHYEKVQRTTEDKTIVFQDNFALHVAHVPGYRKNVSVQRIIHHKFAAMRIRNMMAQEEKPDIIIAGNTPLEVINMVVRYAKQEGIPVCVDIRDLWPDVYIDSVPRQMRKVMQSYVALCRNNTRYAFMNATSIIGLSQTFLEFGLELAGRERKALDTVIPIGYPDYDYSLSKTDFSNCWASHGLTEDDFIIAFTGNFGRQFDFQNIVSAARHFEGHKNIKFVLCGSGENLEKIKGMCPRNVIFPGWIEKDMIVSLLSHASIGIAPYIDSLNYRANTPNKFGEYLSAGLPIAVSVPGSMQDLLTKHECGFHYRNGEDLVEMIRKYTDEPLLLDTHRRNARNLYEDQFNGSKVSQRIFDHLTFVKQSYEINRSAANSLH